MTVKLDEQKRLKILDRLDLWYNNQPKKLAQEFDVCLGTIYKIRRAYLENLRRRDRERMESRTTEETVQSD